MSRANTDALTPEQRARLEESMDPMRRAGRALSNVAFNLAQQRGPLTERDRQSMREAVEQWDDASDATARAALLATVEAVVGEAVGRERDRWAAAARASRESIRSLRRTAGFDARDWGAVSSDAWLYGVLLGWGSALPEIAERHGWNAETCARMEALRASLGRTPDSHVMAARPHDAEGR